MSDPRLVEPQRVPSGAATDLGACGSHRYWCAKRITALALALLLVVAVLSGLWWWVG